MTSVRRAVVALAAVAVLFALSGCAQSAPAPSAVTGTAFSRVVATDSSAAHGFRARLTITVAGRKVAEADARVRTDPKDPAVEETVAISGLAEPVSLIESGGDVYLDLGAASQGKHVKLRPPTAATDPLSGFVLPLLAIGRQAAIAIPGFTDAIVYAQVAGPDTTVGGHRATPWLIDVDTAKLGGSRLPGVDGYLPRQLDLDVWLGVDGRPLRLTADIGSVHEEAVYSDWGDAPLIAVPAKKQLIAAAKVAVPTPTPTASPTPSSPTAPATTPPENGVESTDG